MDIMHNWNSEEYRKRLSQRQVMIQILVMLGFYYVGWLVFSLVTQIWLLVGVCTLNAVVYVVIYWMLKSGKSLKVAVSICYVDIAVFMLVGTSVLGFNSGLHLYILGVLAHWYFYAYDSRERKGGIKSWHMVIFTILVLTICGLCSGRLNYMYTPSVPWVLDAIYAVNLVTCLIMVSWFMGSFVRQVAMLEREMQSKNDALNELAFLDTLTGLANRRKIEEVKHRAEMKNDEYAVILGDIDNFKLVNDRYGHLVGDYVLKQVAQVLRSSIREADIACRWGGEEVLVFLPFCHLEQAGRIAERIRGQIQDLEIKPESGESIYITMTFGVAETSEGTDFQEIVKIADTKLYQGKQNGKNCVVS